MCAPRARNAADRGATPPGIPAPWVRGRSASTSTPRRLSDTPPAYTRGLVRAAWSSLMERSWTLSSARGLRIESLVELGTEARPWVAKPDDETIIPWNILVVAAKS
jgi:hypothetical protein